MLPIGLIVVGVLAILAEDAWSRYQERKLQQHRDRTNELLEKDWAERNQKVFEAPDSWGNGR